MSNRTYICLDCRTARRAEAAGWAATNLRCASCGQSLWELSSRWRIARKSDDQAWNELREIVNREAPLRQQWVKKTGNARLETIERRQRGLEKQGPSRRRDAGLKRLAKERTEVLSRYFPGAGP